MSPCIYETRAAFHSQGYKPVEQAEGDCDICTKQIRSVDAKHHEHSTEDETESGIKLTACGHVLGKDCALRWFKEANSCPFCRTKFFPLGEDFGEDWTDEFAPLIAQLEEREAQGEPARDISDLLAKYGFEFE